MEGLESHPDETCQNIKQEDTPWGGQGGRKRGGKEGGGRGEAGRGQGPSLQRFDGGRKEALQGRLHPAKEKITNEEVQQKKTGLHRKQRKGKKGPAGRVFQAINTEGGESRK